MSSPDTSTADRIRLTLPARGSFADVAAETAATVALRVGFGGAEVDRLRHDVAAAFESAAADHEEHDSILVELIVDSAQLAVHIADNTEPAGHLRHRQVPE